jgi:hypothetical protein
MIINVWLMHKAGEPRTYTSSVRPTKEQLESWKRQGFEVFMAMVHLPIYDDVPTVRGAAFTEKELESSDGEGTGQGS